MSIADKLNQIAANEPLVYEAGKKSQYDEFWDSYQSKGDVYSAQYMYGHAGWNDTTFKPKYSQKYMNSASYMFNTCKITDLKGILESRGLTFDFKNCQGLASFVSYSTITKLPFISAKKSTNLNQFAYRADKLVEAEVALKDDGSQTFTNAFTNCFELVDFIIRNGVIGQDIDFQHSSKLSKASILSIFNALSTTSTGKTLTLNQEAVDVAFETEPQGYDGSWTEEWNKLKETRTNWTISLI